MGLPILWRADRSEGNRAKHHSCRFFTLGSGSYFQVLNDGRICRVDAWIGGFGFELKPADLQTTHPSHPSREADNSLR